MSIDLVRYSQIMGISKNYAQHIPLKEFIYCCFYRQSLLYQCLYSPWSSFHNCVWSECSLSQEFWAIIFLVIRSQFQWLNLPSGDRWSQKGNNRTLEMCLRCFTSARSGSGWNGYRGYNIVAVLIVIEL